MSLVRKIFATTILTTTCLVLLVPNAAASLVYEVEPNNDCDAAYSSGNTIQEGDTHAGQVAYTYDTATNDRIDTWDLGHHYDEVFSAHYAANNALGTDVFVLDEDCMAVCAYFDVGLSANIDCELEESQHYYVQVWVDEPGTVSYQIEFVSFEDIDHPCEEGKTRLEILLECTLPGIL